MSRGCIRAGLWRGVQTEAACRSTRRDFLLAAAAWPALGWMGVARAQPAKSADKLARVGILSTADPKRAHASNRLFAETMRELGWVERRNIVYDYVYADGHEARLPAAAAELVSRKPDVIKVANTAEVGAVLAAAPSIPLIFTGVNHPVASGLVKSLGRPGGNVTGIANIGPELGPRRLQLARQAIPNLNRVGLLVSPRLAPMQVERTLIEKAAGSQLTIIPAVANEPAEFESAFATFAKARVQAVLTTHIELYAREHKRIIDLGAKYRLPVIAHRSELAENGAFMSYSSLRSEQIRRAAHLVDKVLKGTKPADIPVEQPTKFELVVNLKTAKALGITIPQSVLLQAERVIV